LQRHGIGPEGAEVAPLVEGIDAVKGDIAGADPQDGKVADHVQHGGPDVETKIVAGVQPSPKETPNP